jgi:hypothetical protein
VIFPWLLEWAGTIASEFTRHQRGRSDPSFLFEKAYKTILTLSPTKRALNEAASCPSGFASPSGNAPVPQSAAAAHQDVESSHSSNVGPARVASGLGSRAPVS